MCVYVLEVENNKIQPELRNNTAMVDGLNVQIKQPHP
jgi:hypothetical protein